MTKYYLIEQYNMKRRIFSPGDQRDGPTYETSEGKETSVREFATAEKLLEAYKKGPKHGGQLIPAKGIEVKLELILEK